MRVTVLFFANHRDIVGADEVVLALPEGATLAQVAALLAMDYPELGPLLSAARPAVNERFGTVDQPLCEGDRVAFIPPVSGG